MELNDVIRKVRALRALSDRAGTQEEAATAAAAAAALAAKYELAEAALTDGPSNEAPVDVFEMTQGGRRRAGWKSIVANAAAHAHGCHMFSSTRWTPDRGREVLFRAIGRERDVQAATYLYGLVIGDIERLAREGWVAARTTTYESRQRWVSGFKLGAAGKVYRAICEARAFEQNQAAGRARAQAEGAEQALVVIQRRQDRVKEVARALGLVQGRMVRTRSQSGYAAGRQADINVGGNAVASLGVGRAQVGQ